MDKRRKLQGADWVLLGNLVLLAVIFGTFGFLTWQAHGSLLVQTQDRAAAASKVVAAQARWLVGGQFALLDHVAQSEATDIAKQSSDLEVTLYDALGKPTTPLLAGAPSDLAGLDLLDLLRSGERHAVASAIADPTIVLGSRLQAPDGSFAGAVVSVIPRATLEEAWNALKLGPGSTVSLMRKDGVVVARYPAATTRVDLSQMPVFETLMAAPSGTYQSSASPVDGIARVIGFDHVDDIGLVAIAGISQTAVLDGLWKAVVTVTWLLGPIALALLVGAILTSRLLRKTETTRQKLADALTHNEVLFREIHHRVKNNLQSVSAILNLQPIAREVKDEMARRLSAMSAVHEHIYRSNTFGSVDLAAYLGTLVADVRRSAPEVEISETYDFVRVPSDVATPLGLVVNEVISNCVKHAFPDGRKGAIAIHLAADSDRTATLVISDNGVGYDPAQPRSGIGQKLITALSRQIGGEPRFTADNGTRFEISFPAMPDQPADA